MNQTTRTQEKKKQVKIINLKKAINYKILFSIMSHRKKCRQVKNRLQSGYSFVVLFFEGHIIVQVMYHPQLKTSETFISFAIFSVDDIKTMFLTTVRVTGVDFVFFCCVFSQSERDWGCGESSQPKTVGKFGRQFCF